MPGALKTYTSPVGTYWFDEPGILHFRANNTPRTSENIKENFAVVRAILAGAKPCLIADIGEIAPLDKEAREHIIYEIQKIYRAVAFLPNSPLGKVIATTFVVMKTPLFPAKMFDCEEEAKLWLKKYLT